MNFAHQSGNFVKNETRSRCNGLMKTFLTRHAHKHFFAIFLGLLPALSFESSLSARAASFTPTDRMSAIESVNLPRSVDVQAATPPNMSSNTDRVLSSAQALKNSGVEGGSAPGPRSFFLIGLAPIGARLVLAPVEENEKFSLRDTLARFPSPA
jgi:hypothetical protein